MLSRILMAGNFETGPGPTEMEYDSVTDTGYYGVVTSTDLISGDDLATQISLSAGSGHNSTAGWLKFYVGPNADCNVYARGGTGQAYVIFVAIKTFRLSISWNDIDTAKAVDGSDAEITIGGLNYKVRLLTGGDADPTTVTSPFTCADNAGENSEWNDLIYRVHTDTPNCTDPTEGMSGGGETTNHGGPQVGDDWGSLSDSDIAMGVFSWVQEEYGGTADNVIYRGDDGVADFANTLKTGSSIGTAWRPVLELT